MRIQKKIPYPCLGALCLSLIGVAAASFAAVVYLKKKKANE